MTVETRLLFVFGVSAVSSLKSYQSVRNEARIQASPNHKPNGRGQNNPDAVPNKSKRTDRRHVPPNRSVQQPSGRPCIPVPIRGFKQQAKQSDEPRLGVRRPAYKPKHESVQGGKAVDQNSDNI